MNNDIMIDIETLGTRHDAIILTIAAIRFNLGETYPPSRLSESKLKLFYKRIDIDSCKKDGFTQDESCIEWWDKQTDKIKHEAFTKGKRITLRKALIKLSKWIGGEQQPYIWCQGTSFDLPILKNAFTTYGIPLPWKFWMERDVRTITTMVPTYPKGVNKHHALHDCWSQILSLQKALQILNISVIDR